MYGGVVNNRTKKRLLLSLTAKIVLKSVNIWQSYKQESGCLVYFMRLATTLLKDEESARYNYDLVCNFSKVCAI